MAAKQAALSKKQTAEEGYDILNSGFRLLTSAGGHD
jgi:hypothetical protein